MVRPRTILNSVSGSVAWLVGFKTKGTRKYVISHINMLVYKLVMAGINVLLYMTDHILRVPFVISFRLKCL